MATVGVDDGSLQADSQPKSVGLVWGWRLFGTQSAFIEWTRWTLTMALPQWQHYKSSLALLLLLTVGVKGLIIDIKSDCGVHHFLNDTGNGLRHIIIKLCHWNVLRSPGVLWNSRSAAGSSVNDTSAESTDGRRPWIHAGDGAAALWQDHVRPEADATANASHHQVGNRQLTLCL